MRSRSRSRSGSKPRSSKSLNAQSVHSGLISKSTSSSDEKKPLSQRRRERRKLKKRQRRKSKDGQHDKQSKSRRRKAREQQIEEDDDSSIESHSNPSFSNPSFSNDNDNDNDIGYGDGQARRNLKRAQSEQSLDLFKEQAPSVGELRGDSSFGELELDLFKEEETGALNDVDEERSLDFRKLVPEGGDVNHSLGGHFKRRGYQNMHMAGLEDDDDDHPHSSSSDSSSHGTGSGSSSTLSRNKHKPPPIAQREGRRVSRSRWVMIAVLVAVIVVVGTTTHWVFSAQDEETFKKEFLGMADRLVDASTDRANALAARLKRLSRTASAMTQSGGDNVFQKSPWPLVTLSEFEAWGGESSDDGDSTTLFAVLVDSGSLNLWNGYSSQRASIWINESIKFANGDERGKALSNQNRRMVEVDVKTSNPGNAFNSNTSHTDPPENDTSTSDALDTDQIPAFTPYIWKFENGRRVPDRSPAAFSAVLWQSTPVRPELVNYNEYEETRVQELINTKKSVWRQEMGDPTKFATNEDRPYSVILEPVFETVTPSSQVSLATVVAYFKSTVPWDRFMADVLDERDANGSVMAVIQNSCGGGVMTFDVEGPNVSFLGVEDSHDSSFDEHAVAATLNDGSGCEFSVTVYPTKSLRNSYYTGNPTLYTVVGVLIIFSTAAVFAVYDCLVQRHQQKLLKSARRSNAIVNSLFPENVRERLMDKNGGPMGGSIRLKRERKGSTSFSAAVQSNLKAKSFRNPFMSNGSVSGGGGGGGSVDRSESGTKNGNDPTQSNDTSEFNGGDGVLGMVYKTKPIADLFPHSTVLFADIVGFTAWSSVRDPIQVFTLLETLYNSFDRIARRRKVFKVETIGDCYVAVTGLPEPMEEHALVMAKFARDCLMKMVFIVRQLEVVLGPDTGDLSMRFGLHSGPVTAGVLRGEKSRFQLFGDTVNTAARIETTGSRGRIHLSQDCADLIVAAGKSRWVRPRENKVAAKGKGELQTYWLEIGGSGSTKSRDSTETEDFSMDMQRMNESSNSLNVESIVAKFESAEKRNHMSERVKRLVDYNTEVLQKLLKEMIAIRDTRYLQSMKFSEHFSKLHTSCRIGTALEEVKEIIQLPSDPAQNRVDPEAITLSKEAVSQLHNYVTAVASMYRNNPFHSFEHASHVTMSVTKLLSRIVTAESIDYSNIKNMKYKKKAETKDMHEYTFGITSDPLTRFSVAFAALIHDCDHCGVSNSQLVEEGSEIAKLYKNQSVAEQNSVDLAWGLLMEPTYEELRKCIFTTQSEYDRFRQLVVNAVMATDIMDRDLGELRRRRWEKAFSGTGSLRSSRHSRSGRDQLSIESANRKATIVIEHLIQASDVAHTMQHWNIYVKWNRNLFFEMYDAYEQGRAAKDPSETWFQGELGFFDFYIIPLAKKLKDCGVFGVASDEYLNYALANRRDWEMKGQEVLQEYIVSYKKRGEKARDNPTATLTGSNSSLLNSLHNTSRRFSMTNTIFK